MRWGILRRPVWVIRRRFRLRLRRFQRPTLFLLYEFLVVIEVALDDVECLTNGLDLPNEDESHLVGGHVPSR